MLAEKAVLGSALLGREALERICGELRPDDFERPEHQEIFSAIFALFNANEPVDPVTVADKLGGRVGGIQYITEIVTGTVSAANVDYHIKVVLEESRKRHAISGLREVVKDMKSGKDEGYLDRMQGVIDAVRARGGRKVSRVGKDFDAALYGLINGAEGLTTGFQVLDQTLGGLKRGHLTIIGARPSVGKTSLAMNIAVNMALFDRTVAVFSLEMPREDVLQRAIISYAKCSRDEMFSGGQEAVDRIQNAVSKLSATRLYLSDNAYTVEAIRSQCYAIKQQERELDLIAIDYLGLIQSSLRNRTRENEVSDISRKIKLLAKELNVPVVLLCQLNRAIEGRNDGRPRLSDLRESGAIEQDADEVLLLHRPDPQSENASIIVAKNRNGQTGELSVKWYGKYFLYEDEIVEWEEL